MRINSKVNFLSYFNKINKIYLNNKIPTKIIFLVKEHKNKSKIKYSSKKFLNKIIKIKFKSKLSLNKKKILLINW